jgi:Flp pilus assembly protein TadB
MLFVGISIAIGILVAALAIVRFQGSSQVREDNKELFAQAVAQEKDNFAGRLLVSAGSRFSGLPYTNIDEESPGYRSLRYKIASSGGLFANSVTVFLSTQVAAALISMLVLAVAVFSGLPGIVLFALVAFAFAFTLYPYQRLSGTAKKRTAQVNQDLPAFAELLLMPLSGGFGIISALEFASERSDNIVAREVRVLIKAFASRSVSEEQAFEEAGARLGTPGAVAFFNTLAQSYFEGAQAVSAIRGQAEQLRKIAFQDTRAKLKSLPTQLVIVIGIHLMPTLFLVILVPVGLQLAGSL